MKNAILCIQLTDEGCEIIENLTIKLKKSIKGTVQFLNRVSNYSLLSSKVKELLENVTNL